MNTFLACFVAVVFGNLLAIAFRFTVINPIMRWSFNRQMSKLRQVQGTRSASIPHPVRLTPEGEYVDVPPDLYAPKIKFAMCRRCFRGVAGDDNFVCPHCPPETEAA